MLRRAEGARDSFMVYPPRRVKRPSRCIERNRERRGSTRFLAPYRVGCVPPQRKPSVIRLVGVQVLESNDEWAVARRYMSL